MNNDVILFRTYYWNEFVEKQLRTLVENCPYEVVLLQDTTNNPIAETDLCKVLGFDYKTYEGMGYPLATEEQIDTYGTPPPKGNKARIIYYNVEYAQVLFSRMFPNYDHYWHWEYDLMFNGHYDKLWERLENNEADLLSMYLLQYPQGHGKGIGWRHNSHVIEDDFMFRQLGALWRGSKKLMDALHTMLSNGFHNHSEQIIPTVAAISGLKIADFNATGKNSTDDFTMLYNIATVSVNAEPKELYIKAFGLEEMFFHPIKNEKQLQERLLKYEVKV